MKVFGVGLNKTGTKTLCEALKILGFKNSQSSDVKNSPIIRWELTNHWKNQNFEPIIEFSKDYNNFEDWPWPLVYQIMYKTYEDAKFILTVRKSPEVWYESLCKHAKRVSDSRFSKMIYGYHMPHDFKKEHISFYKTHNEDVCNYFNENNSDRLLVLCFEDGDAWSKLCTFLDQKIPQKPFPHKNNSEDLEKTSNPLAVSFIRKYRQMKKLFK